MTEAVTHQIYCRFCVAHCGLIVEVEDGVATSVRGDPSHPLSQGYTCAKGRSSVMAHYDQRRLDHPLRRRTNLVAQEEAGWSSSLDEIAQGIGEILQSEGPDAVGLFIGTGGSHDAAGRRLGVKWLRALGSRSQYSVATVDAPAKPLVAELVTGSPALFSPVLDVENTRLTILIGSNPLVSHGHTSGWPNPRVRLSKLMSDGEVWVVDPRRTETAMVATRHLAPRVGTDHIWLAAIANELLSTTDRANLESRATGVPALEQALSGYTLTRGAEESGLDPEDLKRLLALIRGGRVAIQSGTGVSMSAAAPVTEWLILVIQILTDSLDQEGGSWFNPGFLRSMDKVAITIGDGTGQPGPASRPELRARLGEFPAVALADEILSGNLKALVVFGANLITALPDAERTREALSRLELLVVLDVMENETTRMATHVLPCAGVLERADLPFITDMYVPAVATQYAGAVLPLTAGRRPAWRIFSDLGSRLGMDLLDGLSPDVATDDDLLRPMTARAHEKLDDLVALPGCHVAESPRVGWVRNSVLPDGKWRIAPTVLVDRLREISREPQPRGLMLLPRRQLRQLNSQLTESGTKDRRFARPSILVHPDDAAELGLHDGSRVRATSRHGSMTGDLVFDRAASRGTVSIPHGHATANINHLTSNVHDIEPLTGMMLSSGVHVELAAIS